MTRLDLLLARPDVTRRGLHIMPLRARRSTSPQKWTTRRVDEVFDLEMLVATRRVRESYAHTRDLTHESRTPHYCGIDLREQGRSA